MSVYIPGMEMPKNCWECGCHHHKVDEGYYDYDACRASGAIFNDGYSSVTGNKVHIGPFKQRLDNCPLIPVPEHGKLIDADALMAHFEKIADIEWNKKAAPISWSYAFEDVMDDIENAPTIIPADKESEG